MRGSREGSPQARRSGHGDQARKWAFGPLGTSTPTGPDLAGAAIWLQVRLLDDGLSERLLAAAKPGHAVRLGLHDYEITEEPRLTEQVSWQALRRWPGARAWQVRFVTPVCLRRGNRTSPWPAPESVARGLAERWHRLDPQTAPPAPGPGAGPVWVSDIEGHNEVQTLTRNIRRDHGWRLEDEVISGFVGRIRYVCDRGTDAEAAAFDALMAFAAFAGVGSHTTYGFGVVHSEPTWQPPTVRTGG
jgi:CRISPR-associated endoribonuclease Cas6